MTNIADAENKDIFEWNQDVLNAAYQVEGLAKAYMRIGNHNLAEELFLLSENLLLAHQGIKKCAGKMAVERAKQADESTRNMVEAVVVALSTRKANENSHPT